MSSNDDDDDDDDDDLLSVFLSVFLFMVTGSAQYMLDRCILLLFMILLT